MAADLVDQRLKITAETQCVLEAEHRATGRDISAIARDVLHAWASSKINKANVLQRLLAGKGIRGDAQGMSAFDAPADPPEWTQSQFDHGMSR